MRNVDAALPRFAMQAWSSQLRTRTRTGRASSPTAKRGSRRRRVEHPVAALNYDIGNAYTYAEGRINLSADLEARFPRASILLKDGGGRSRLDLL